MLADAVADLRSNPPLLVAIGASAGAVQALSALLPQLPSAFPVPILVLVHLPPGRRNALPPLFSGLSTLTVIEVEDKMPLAPGRLYVAAPDYHLLVEQGLVAALSTDEPVQNCRPSIDVLFESVADACGAGAAGILLSGANDDGARGLAAMHGRGAVTWVQTPESSEVPTMPKAALALVEHRQLKPETMGGALAHWGRARA